MKQLEEKILSNTIGPRKGPELLMWFLVISTGLYAIADGARLVIEQYRNMPILIHIVPSILAQTYTLLALFHSRDIRKVARQRIFIDNIILLTALAVPHHMPSVAYFYVIATWAHVVTNMFFLDAETTVTKFLFGANIIALILGSYQLRWSSDLMTYFAAIAMTTVVGLIVQFIRKKELNSRRLQMEIQRIRELEIRLLRHNFTNSVSVLLGNLEYKNQPQLYNMAKKTTDDIANYLRQIDSQKSNISLASIVKQAVSYCQSHHNIEIEYNVEPDHMVYLRGSSLLFSLVAVLTNASEADANRVKLVIQDSKLVVTDNGKGFDSSKVRWGYTTKKQGHGYGLVTSMDLCRRNGVGMQIQSKIGHGTTVTFDLSRVAATSCSQCHSSSQS